MAREVKNARGHADRRDVLKGVAIAAGLGSSPAFGQMIAGGAQPAMAPGRIMGVLGAANAGPDRPKIGPINWSAECARRLNLATKPETIG